MARLRWWLKNEFSGSVFFGTLHDSFMSEIFHRTAGQCFINVVWTVLSVDRNNNRRLSAAHRLYTRPRTLQMFRIERIFDVVIRFSVGSRALRWHGNSPKKFYRFDFCVSEKAWPCSTRNPATWFINAFLTKTLKSLKWNSAYCTLSMHVFGVKWMSITHIH